MTKICVFSDSHGYGDPMLHAIRVESPDLIIHLGDGESDLAKVKGNFPDLEIRSVRGNCDVFSAEPVLLQTEVEGKKIFATHGHTYNVKLDRDYRRLRYAALESDARIVLFGHTHIPYHDRCWGMEILNPGSICAGPSPSYGVLVIDGDDMTAQLKRT